MPVPAYDQTVGLDISLLLRGCSSGECSRMDGVTRGGVRFDSSIDFTIPPAVVKPLCKYLQYEIIDLIFNALKAVIFFLSMRQS